MVKLPNMPVTQGKGHRKKLNDIFVEYFVQLIIKSFSAMVKFGKHLTKVEISSTLCHMEKSFHQLSKHVFSLYLKIQPNY